MTAWFNTEIPIRFSDLDIYGHVNNVLFCEYLQQARVQFFEHDASAMAALTSGLVVVEHKINYLAPIKYREEAVKIQLGISGLGGAKIGFDYQVWQKDILCAKAYSLLCPYDFDAKKPKRLGSDLREFLNSWRVKPNDFEELASLSLNGRGVPEKIFVRWSDSDRYGHVNNVKYLDFFMQARTRATAKMHPSLDRENAKWFIARQDLQYIAQTSYSGQPLVINTAPVRIGTSSLTLNAELISQGEVLAKSQSVLVYVEENGKTSPISDETKSAITAYLLN